MIGKFFSFESDVALGTAPMFVSQEALDMSNHLFLETSKVISTFENLHLLSFEGGMVEGIGLVWKGLITIVHELGIWLVRIWRGVCAFFRSLAAKAQQSLKSYDEEEKKKAATKQLGTEDLRFAVSEEAFGSFGISSLFPISLSLPALRVDEVANYPRVDKYIDNINQYCKSFQKAYGDLLRQIDKNYTSDAPRSNEELIAEFAQRFGDNEVEACTIAITKSVENVDLVVDLDIQDVFEDFDGVVFPAGETQIEITRNDFNKILAIHNSISKSIDVATGSVTQLSNLKLEPFQRMIAASNFAGDMQVTEMLTKVAKSVVIGIRMACQILSPNSIIQMPHYKYCLKVVNTVSNMRR